MSSRPRARSHRSTHGADRPARRRAALVAAALCALVGQPLGAASATSAIPAAGGSAAVSVTPSGSGAPVPLVPPVPPVPVVRDNRLVDARTGEALRAAGVNRSGTEYACIQGWGFSDGPVDDAALAAIASWGTNVVRLPLNETCWLGINGAAPPWSGTSYRDRVADLVRRLHEHGQAVVLDLHWAAAGDAQARDQAIAPNADHTPDFWRSVAQRFADDPSVMFELFNEPREIDWACWRDGCATGRGWRAAGTQELVDAVRSTGAQQPVVLDGLNWGGDLSGWVEHAPDDPAGQVVAGWHTYSFSQCRTEACWDDTAGRVARSYPVLLTELGQDDCAGGFVQRLLDWADAHDVGYLAWAWNVADCAGGPSLVSDYDGTPTGYGAVYRRHLATRTTPVSPGVPTPTTPEPGDGFDFEARDAGGWTRQWGPVAATTVSGRAFSGDGALAVDVRRPGYAAVGTTDGVDSLSGGAWVTMRVRAPRGRGAPPTVSPVLLDGRWRPHVLRPWRLRPGAWQRVSVAVPGRVGQVRMLGLQVDNPDGWSGRLLLDAVRVSPVRAGFEAGTDAWSARWGRLDVSRTARRPHAGAGALRVVARESGYAAVGTDRVGSVAPGDVVRLRVRAAPQETAPPTVSPVVLDSRWDPRVLAAHRLRPGRWQLVAFRVPADVDVVRAVGLQVDAAAARPGPIDLDSVSW